MVMDAQQIYDNFHGSGAKGTGALDQAQQLVYGLSDHYQQSAVHVQQVINSIGGAWTGQAAEAATRGLAPMAENLLFTGDALNTHQDLVYRQAQSYQRAASQVQPVPPQPSMVDIASLAMTGIATGNAGLVAHAQSMYDQVQAHNAVSQANIDAYDTYVQASTYNSANLPTMSETMTDTISDQVAVRTTASSGDAARGGAGSPSGVRAPGTSIATDRGRRVGLSAPTETAESPPTISGSSRVTAPPSSDTTPNTTESATGGGSGGRSGTGTTASGGVATGAAPASGSSTSFGSSGGLASPIDTGAPGGTGELVTGGDSGPVDDGVGDRGGAVPVDEEPGGRSGVAAGNSAAAQDEAVAGERAAATPAETGVMGGGRGGKGGPDGAHRRKVALTGDPGIFGGIEPTVAPVIGETREQYLARLAREDDGPG